MRHRKCFEFAGLDGPRCVAIRGFIHRLLQSSDERFSPGRAEDARPVFAVQVMPVRMAFDVAVSALCEAVRSHFVAHYVL
jgi:hypothetical protein